MNTPEVIGALATPAMVIGLTTFVKQLGVKGKALTIVPMVFGIGAAFAQAYADAQVIETVVLGIQLGLAGAGIYDIANKLERQKDTPGKHEITEG